MPQDITSGFRCFGSNLQILSFFYGQIHRKVTEIFVDRITLKLQTTTCTPFQCDQMAKLFKVFGNQQE